MCAGGFVLRLFRPPTNNTAANARTNKSTNHEQLALETAEYKPIGDSFLSALTAAQHHAQRFAFQLA